MYEEGEGVVDGKFSLAGGSTTPSPSWRANDAISMLPEPKSWLSLNTLHFKLPTASQHSALLLLSLILLPLSFRCPVIRHVAVEISCTPPRCRSHGVRRRPSGRARPFQTILTESQVC